jgi:group II intron reverse transcriptase/maturase
MRDKSTRFTALMHHITPEILRESFETLNYKAVPGVDGVSYKDFSENLEANISALWDEVQKGTYKPLPGLRTFIPKQDGSKRPLAIASTRDKVVQRALAMVLEQIYEVDFKDVSFGFRPLTGCHNALDRLFMDITTRNVNFIIDADIKSYFNSIDRGLLLQFLERRVADQRVLRLIKKILNAGVLEDGIIRDDVVGAAQGSSISPLLANVFLHYVLDEWFAAWKKRACGEVRMVRYADDFVIGCQCIEDAVVLLDDLGSRLEEFKLSLHPDKTILIEFGKHAMENRSKRGGGKPETFNFLGFTHICAKSRNQKVKFKLLRLTINERLAAKLKEIKAGLRLRINRPIKIVGQWLNRVLTGYFNYYAIPGNLGTLGRFRYLIGRAWMWGTRRRSHKARMTWARFTPIIEKWLPLPKAKHPYPNQRCAF